MDQVCLLRTSTSAIGFPEEAGVYLTRSQPGLQRKFKDTQCYLLRPTLKLTKCLQSPITRDQSAEHDGGMKDVTLRTSAPISI